MMSGLLPPLSSRTSTMSHPTCCCSVSLDRCDRCDLLVDLEGFHLMSAVRTPDALVLDVESCNQLAGCPDCGVIAQGHGRVVVEVIDAPWAGVPVRIRWHKRRWICREHTCQITTFAEQNHSVCAPRARLGVRAIRWAIRQLRFEGATISGLARQLGTTWNTVWSHIKPCLQAACDDPARFAGVQVLGVDEHVWHHQDRRRRGPRELTGIVDLTRGKDHPTARLSGPGPRKVRRRVPELAAERGEDFRAGVRIARLDPLPGTARTPLLGLLQDATSVLDAFHIVTLAGDAPGEVRRQNRQDTTGHRGRTGDPLYQIRLLQRASHTQAHPTPSRNDSAQPSRQMRHISVSKSPTTAPSKYARFFIKPHPPKDDTWPLVLSRAYQRVPSPTSLAWAGPCASGRTRSTPTSILAEPATHRAEAINGIIELGRRTARGHPNPTNYQLRMLLTAGLNASPHTQL